jgi:hypothetical protein
LGHPILLGIQLGHPMGCPNRGGGLCTSYFDNSMNMGITTYSRNLQ